MLFLHICLRGETKQQYWYLDSGCSRHITREKLMFQTLTLKKEGRVGFEGWQKGKTIGTETTGNSLISINNVWLVSGLKHNLLSISQFWDSGYEVLFEKNFCLKRTFVLSSMSLTNPLCSRERGREMCIKLISLNWLTKRLFSLYPVSDEKWVWHNRLGQANWRLISKLSKLKLVKGLPNLNYHSNALCGACKIGKINKIFFKSKNIVLTSKALNFFELIYLILLGLLQSMGRSMDWSLLMITADGLD